MQIRRLSFTLCFGYETDPKREQTSELPPRILSLDHDVFSRDFTP